MISIARLKRLQFHVSATPFNDSGHSIYIESCDENGGVLFSL